MTSRVHDERGSVSIFIAVLGVAFVMVAGLAIDGGRKLGALSEARDLADNAARAGAQAVDADTYRTTGIVVRLAGGVLGTGKGAHATLLRGGCASAAYSAISPVIASSQRCW